MASTDPQAGEPGKTDKEYVEIIQSDVEIEKKFITEEGLPSKIVYFCQDCKEPIKPKRVGKKFQFSCTQCKGKNVSFGSEQSVQNYYSKIQKEKEREKSKAKSKK